MSLVAEFRNTEPEPRKPKLACRTALTACLDGGKGNLEHVMRDPAKAKLYAHLKDKDGNWFGNAESYFLIGNALGEAMKKLLEAGAGG